MAAARKPTPPPLAPPELESFPKLLARTYEAIRAQRIREARARIPTPSYDQIAVEVGCSVRTVYNVVKGLTHAPAQNG